jgi:hypothetical protein
MHTKAYLAGFDSGLNGTGTAFRNYRETVAAGIFPASKQNSSEFMRGFNEGLRINASRLTIYKT